MFFMLLSILRCPVFRRLREEAEKRKRPSWNELKGRKGDGEGSGDAKHSATPSRNSTRDQPEPGLINPAYEEGEEGMELFYYFKTRNFSGCALEQYQIIFIEASRLNRNISSW